MTLKTKQTSKNTKTLQQIDNTYFVYRNSRLLYKGESYATALRHYNNSLRLKEYTCYECLDSSYEFSNLVMDNMSKCYECSCEQEKMLDLESQLKK